MNQAVESDLLRGEEPGPVWYYFERISLIPRCSGNEQALIDFIEEESRKFGASFRRDGAGNVILGVDGRGARKDGEILVLQSHLDMVCEKNRDAHHDFQKDPIRFKRKGDELQAVATTLGADNGIGVAVMLAIAAGLYTDHPPLELLFTIDEERGLTGAMGLTEDSIKGRRLLNLDTEEEGAFYVGCAGGGDIRFHMSESERQPARKDAVSLDINLFGLLGGHSGMDISRGRGNAVQLLARLLFEACELERDFLHSFEGGDKKNAIPREARATIVSSNPGELKRKIEESFQNISREYVDSEPGIRLEINESGAGVDVLHGDFFSRLIALILSIPHGPFTYSKKIHGQVVTSNNLASVRRAGEDFIIECHSRSEISTAMEAVRDRIGAAGFLAGARVEKSGAYPGWAPDMDSALLEIAKKIYKEVFGSEPKVKTIHAGLETGVIQSRVGKMDLLSVGPEIRFPHSPDETVLISSVERFSRFLGPLLSRL